MAHHYFLRALHGNLINRENLVDDPEQSIECRLDGIAPIYGDIAMKNLLKHLGVGNKTLPITDEFL
jgi:hypothetical protein